MCGHFQLWEFPETGRFFYKIFHSYKYLSSLSWSQVNSYINNILWQAVPQIYHPVPEESLLFACFDPGSHKPHFMATFACSGRGIQQQSALAFSVPLPATTTPPLPTFPYHSWVCQPLFHIGSQPVSAWMQELNILSTLSCILANGRTFPFISWLLNLLKTFSNTCCQQP